ncbi:MAG: 50S ribosomal protein L9 [Clostridiales bacterium]|nr:50S ribosomal protein L9 [Clostridiales bacterium]
MKVILLEDVKSQGKKGDVVNVSDGYARNMLFPKKLAVPADAKNLNDLKLQHQRADRQAAENLAAAKELSEKLENTTVEVKLKGGEGGKAFGSVSAKEIAVALKEQTGIDVDKKKMHLKENLKNLGSYDVPVKLHPQVTAKLTVRVTEG